MVKTHTSHLLFGRKAIAAFLQLDTIHTQSLIDRGILPTFRRKGALCANKQAVTACFEAFKSLIETERKNRC